jgi:hypothetical protein
MSEHRPPTPDDVQHVNKKIRLDTDVEGADVAPTQLDAPVDAMVLQAPSEDKSKTKTGGQKAGTKARKNKKRKEIEPYSNEHLIHLEIKALLGEDVVAAAEEEGRDTTPPFEKGTVLELTVKALSPTGTYDSALTFSVDLYCIKPYLFVQDQFRSSFAASLTRAWSCALS